MVAMGALEVTAVLLLTGPQPVKPGLYVALPPAMYVIERLLVQVRPVLLKLERVSDAGRKLKVLVITRVVV